MDVICNPLLGLAGAFLSAKPTKDCPNSSDVPSLCPHHTQHITAPYRRFVYGALHHHSTADLMIIGYIYADCALRKGGRLFKMIYAHCLARRCAYAHMFVCRISLNKRAASDCGTRYVYICQVTLRRVSFPH